MMKLRLRFRLKEEEGEESSAFLSLALVKLS